MVPYSLLPSHSAQHRLKLVFKKDDVTSAFLSLPLPQTPCPSLGEAACPRFALASMQALFTLSQILTTQHVETGIKERGSVRQ